MAAFLQIFAGLCFFVWENNFKGYKLGGTFHLIGRISPFVWVLAARFVSGIACGLAHLAVTVHASDFGSKRMRQVTSYAIAATIAVSVTFYSAMINFWYFSRIDSPSEQKLGIGFNLIVFGAVAMLLTPILTNEAVPYYLIRGDDEKARKKFIKPKSERRPRAMTLQKFDEFQAMIEEDKHIDGGILSGDNFMSLYIVIITRLLHVVTSCLPLLMLMMSEVGSWGAVQFRSIDSGFLTELSAARIIVGTIVLIVASWFGRHKFIYIGTILTSGIFIVLFLQNIHLSWTAQLTLRSVINYTVPVGYAFFSFGVDYYQMKQSVAVDAFPVTQKACSLAIVATIEHLTHAGLIAIFIHRLEELKVLIAGAIIVLSFVSVAVVPDTKKLSLRATRNLFSGLVPSVNAV